MICWYRQIELVYVLLFPLFLHFYFLFQCFFYDSVSPFCKLKWGVWWKLYLVRISGIFLCLYSAPNICTTVNVSCAALFFFFSWLLTCYVWTLLLFYNKHLPDLKKMLDYIFFHIWSSWQQLQYLLPVDNAKSLLCKWQPTLSACMCAPSISHWSAY